MEIHAKRFQVSGKVQGVGFRYFVEREAARLDICGYVKNLNDGSVEVYAIGDAGRLEALRNELRQGPTMSQVTRVDEADADVLTKYSKHFTIERDY